MGEVKGNASALFSAGYSPLPGLSLSVSSDIPLSNRENGANVHFEATGQVYGRSDAKGMQKDSVTIGGQLAWGERKYVQTMYGVTATQAANTSFKQYTPKAVPCRIAKMARTCISAQLARSTAATMPKACSRTA